MGEEFDRSYLSTKGADFASSRVEVPDLQEEYIMAQFWILHPGKQWGAVRQLYFRGTSGLILLVDSEKKSQDNLLKYIREFVGINKGVMVPVLVLGTDAEMTHDSLSLFSHDIQRWTGFRVPTKVLDGSNIDDLLRTFLLRVRHWRARTMVQSTLRMYFALDSITQKKRDVKQILSHLRSIYLANMYQLIPDEELIAYIRESAVESLFQYDGRSIIYTKSLMED